MSGTYVLATQGHGSSIFTHLLPLGSQRNYLTHQVCLCKLDMYLPPTARSIWYNNDCYKNQKTQFRYLRPSHQKHPKGLVYTVAH